jgi:hypothetical protein
LVPVLESLRVVLLTAEQLLSSVARLFGADASMRGVLLLLESLFAVLATQLTV